MFCRCAFVKSEEVDGAGTAGGGGDFRLLRPEELVDERRFADVGAAQEGDFRGAGGAGVVGEVVGAHRGEQELGGEAHRFSLEHFPCCWGPRKSCAEAFPSRKTLMKVAALGAGLHPQGKCSISIQPAG